MAAPPSPSGSFLMLNPSTNSIGLWNSGSFMSFSGASKVNASPLVGGDCSTRKLPPSPQRQRSKNAAAPPYLVDLMRVFGWTVTSREDDAAVYAFSGGSTCYSAASAFEKFACDSAKNAKTTLTVRKGPPESVSQTEVNDSSAFDGERSASRSRERISLEKSALDSAKNEKASLTEGESPTKNVNQADVNDSSAFARERSASRSRERNSSGKCALNSAKNGKTTLAEGEGPSTKNIIRTLIDDTSVFDRERSAHRSRERTGSGKSAWDYTKNGKTSLTDGESPTKNVNQTEVNDSSAFDRERSGQSIRERTSLGKSALDYAKNGKTSLTEGEGPSKNVNQAEVNETFAFDRERSGERNRERTSLGKSAWNYSKNGKTSLTEGENPLKSFSQTEVDDSSAFDRERSGQIRRERTSLGRSALDSAKNGKTGLNEGESPSKKVSQAEVNETSAFDRERSARRSREITSFGKCALDSAKNGKTILKEGESPAKKVSQAEVNETSSFDRGARREITSFGKSAWVSAKNGNISLTEGEGPSKNVNQTEVNGSAAFDREISAQRIRERTSFGKSALDSAKSGKTIVTEGEGPPKNDNQSEVNGSSAFDRERSAPRSRKRAILTEGESPSKKVHQKGVNDSSSFDRKRSRERISFGKSALDSEKNGKANVTEEEGPSKRVKQKEVNDSSDFDRERSTETSSFRKPTPGSPKNGKTSLTEGEGPSKVNQEVNDSSAFYRERGTERTSFGKSAWDFPKTVKTSLTEGDSPSKKVNQMEVNDSFTFDRERRSSQRREISSLGKSAWDSERNWKTSLTSQEGPWKKVNQTEINGFTSFGRERNSLEKFAWDSAKNVKTSSIAQESPPKKIIQTEVNNSPVFERERSLEKGSEGTLGSPSIAVEESGRKRSWNKVNPSTELNEQSAKKKQKQANELTVPPNSGTDGDKRADSPPLTLGNNWKSKNLTMQEAHIEKQRRSFKRTERTRRSSNSLVEPVQGRRKNRKNTCSSAGELTLREKLKDVDQERKMTALSWMIDSGALTENEPLVHKVNARGLATREGILCGCCKKTMSLAEFDFHAGSDWSQPWYNISLTSGKSLMQCNVEAWEKEKKLRSLDFLTVHGESDPSDDSCGVCAEGGHLICCDNCPSTFHQDCLKLEELPEGKWYCPYCTCMFCLVSEGMNDTSSLFTCQQCSCKYHWQCTRESRVTEKLAQSLLFCGEDCKEVDGALFSCLARENKIGEGFSWSLLKCLEEHEKVNSGKRLSLTMECNRKLSMVAELFHECFIPMVDLRTGVDLISRAVFNCGSNLKRVDCAGFYTMVLEKDEEIISAATIRFHGRGVAEMPFIGTRPMYSRQGMCRRLFGAIEKLLLTLRVKKLLIPAAPELAGTWVDSFSFNPVEKSDNQEIRNLGLLTFPETILLEKSITVTR